MSFYEFHTREICVSVSKYLRWTDVREWMCVVLEQTTNLPPLAVKGPRILPMCLISKHIKILPPLPLKGLGVDQENIPFLPPIIISQSLVKMIQVCIHIFAYVTSCTINIYMIAVCLIIFFFWGLRGRDLHYHHRVLKNSTK